MLRLLHDKLTDLARAIVTKSSHAATAGVGALLLVRHSLKDLAVRIFKPSKRAARLKETVDQQVAIWSEPLLNHHILI
jgi:hypothetical protein